MDISEEIIKLGKEYFGFKEEEKLKSVIGDAYEYVKKNESEKFDVILMDVNYEEKEIGMSPPFKFVSTDFLD